MPEQVAGFPFWQITFDEEGKAAADSEAEQLIAGLPGQGLTDLVICAHGWNNDRTAARNLYRRLLEQMRGVLERPNIPMRRTATIGAAGVIWPSKRWADEDVPEVDGGGAAGLEGRPSDDKLVRDLKDVFTKTAQREALDELATLLRERPEDPGALKRFQDLMGVLAVGEDAAAAPEDSGERALLDEPPREVFERFAALAEPAPGPDEGGAAGLGDLFDRVWNGAREALRQATYWQMKKRAGVVGKNGLGPLIGRLQQAQPDLRVHLVGHSFGARVVSFALAGLPDGAGPGTSPVKSLTLLQGAFSHFAFAAKLPHAPRRGGALAGMAARVDGPLLVSFSEHDTAVGKFYPAASVASGDDAAGLEDVLFRWGAIGHDGAQAVTAAKQTFGTVGQVYTFTPGAFLNLDGNDLIVAGDSPSGAHGDIFHPEIAWAMLCAAGVTGG